MQDVAIILLKVMIEKRFSSITSDADEANFFYLNLAVFIIIRFQIFGSVSSWDNLPIFCDRSKLLVLPFSKGKSYFKSIKKSYFRRICLGEICSRSLIPKITIFPLFFIRNCRCFFIAIF